jgi:hypothetical protein
MEEFTDIDDVLAWVAIHCEFDLREVVILKVFLPSYDLSLFLISPW